MTLFSCVDSEYKGDNGNFTYHHYFMLIIFREHLRYLEK